MRLTLTAFALVVISLSFLPVVVLRAATPIQTKTNTHAGPASSNSITFDSTPTIGNTVVCSFHSNGTSNLTSVTGGVTSWTPRFTHTATNQKLYVRDGTADGSTTVTMTMTSNASTPSLICAELDGAYTYDSQATVATGTGNVATNTVTTAAVNTFLFAVITKGGGSTTGAPTDSFNAISYSPSESDGRYVGAYRNATSSDGYSTTWTSNTTAWAATIVVYAEPSSGGGGGGAVTKGLTLLGVGNN